jgi:hypothetical protein
VTRPQLVRLVFPQLEGIPAVLPQGWSTLIALLDGHPDADPMTRVQRLCDLCVQVSGATGATLAISSGDLRSTVCATDPVSDRLEELQLTFSEGPAVTAVKDGWSVLVPDLADGSDTRWPLFAPAAVEEGARAYFTFPVQVGAIRLGVLSLYRVVSGMVGPDRVRDIRVLADAAAVLLTVGTGAQSAEAFVWALDDRSRFRAEVHQAVGATTVQLGVTAGQAFALLCAHAFATGTPIAGVAADIMAKRLTLQSS